MVYDAVIVESTRNYMDVSVANLEPYRRYHDFHDELNSTLKVLSAAAQYTVATVSVPQSSIRLGDLIKAADPSWKYPPIWDHHPRLGPAMLGSIAQLGIISVWSALDDFRVGVEAEVSRWESFSGQTLARVELAKSDEERESPLNRFLDKYCWRADDKRDLLTVLSFFGTMRNCIAHRAGKASPLLVETSAMISLQTAYRTVVDAGERTLPRFGLGEEILVHPKLAILYSHLGRKIAMHVNSKLVPILGADGILNMAAFHTPYLEHPRAGKPRFPEAALNLALKQRYRVSVLDKDEAPRRLRELGQWKRFARSYEPLDPSPTASSKKAKRSNDQK